MRLKPKLDQQKARKACLVEGKHKTASDGPESSVEFWQGASGPACSEEPSKAGRARRQAPTRQPFAYAPAVSVNRSFLSETLLDFLSH